MMNRGVILALSFATVLAAGVVYAATVTDPPPWAYPVNPPDDAAPKDDGSARHVPGSSLALTLTQTTDRFNVPDWHPDDHPQMPEVVAHGKKPDQYACGFCHLPNGEGRPENASLVGLTADYIEDQVAAFKSGDRKTSEPKMTPPGLMVGVAKAAPDDDVKVAAEYFASLKPKIWIRVVEADMVPKTHVTGSMLVVMQGGEMEPIGDRIIETPENHERTELRDAASGFIAYVPTGSIAKGESLVKTGGLGKTTQCAICHGADLKGVGDVPPLAGRSPSYIVRQLVDIQDGSRTGDSVAPMKPIVAKLSLTDMVDLAAYAASLNP